MAKQMRPELKTVGLVWNPTESNSEAQTRLARAVCPELGITLLEANAENSTGVAEAANSLTARGVEALLLTGDVTVMMAADLVVAAAKRAKIPVFSVIPPTAKKGALSISEPTTTRLAWPPAISPRMYWRAASSRYSH